MMHGLGPFIGLSSGDVEEAGRCTRPRVIVRRPREGKRADFILIDLSKPTMTPVYTEPIRNIVPNLV